MVWQSMIVVCRGLWAFPSAKRLSGAEAVARGRTPATPYARTRPFERTSSSRSLVQVLTELHKRWGKIGMPRLYRRPAAPRVSFVATYCIGRQRISMRKNGTAGRRGRAQHMQVSPWSETSTAGGRLNMASRKKKTRLSDSSEEVLLASVQPAGASVRKAHQDRRQGPQTGVRAD